MNWKNGEGTLLFGGREESSLFGGLFFGFFFFQWGEGVLGVFLFGLVLIFWFVFVFFFGFFGGFYGGGGVFFALLFF